MSFRTSKQAADRALAQAPLDTSGALAVPAVRGARRIVGGASGALAPFAYGLFASVWIANTVSNFGSQIQGVGAARLMTSLTRDPTTVSLVTGATLLPILLLSLVSGAIADAFDRRFVLLLAQAIMFSAALTLSWLSAAGAVTPAMLIVLTFFIGCGLALNAPAWQAAVRELVPLKEVPAAISLNIVGFNLSRTAGPAVGGLVVAIGGPKTAFMVNTISFIGLLIVLAWWLRRPATAERRPRESILPAIRAGLAHSIRAVELRRILVRVTLFGVALGALLALLPLVVRHLQGGPTGLGVVYGCSGGGAVLGALVANRLRLQLGPERQLRLSILLCSVAMATVALSPWLALTGAAEVVTGFATTLVYTSANVLTQLLAPRRLLGRIVSIYQMGAFGGLAAGTWVWGAVAKHTSVSTSLLGAAALMLAMLLLGRGMPLVEATPLEEETGA